MVVAARRLPGIRFEAAPTAPAVVLPRMDVAAFVGFAASGPIGVPVAVQDPGAFDAIFGRDAPLFWDDRTGTQAYAHLGPAVRAYFRNGGRRCFAIRVAGRDARSCSFVLPGLLARAPGGALHVPLFRARSEGSWADDVRVATALVETPVPATPLDLAALTFRLPPDGPSQVAPGDLLRLTLRGAGYVLLAAVSGVEDATIRCDRDTAVWLQRRRPPVGARGPASFLDVQGTRQLGVAHVERDIRSRTGELVRVTLAARSADLPAPGSLLHATIGGDELWVLVTQAGVGRVQSRRSEQVVSFLGRAFWPVAPPERSFALQAFDAIDTLTFELWAQRTAGEQYRLTGLGFAPGHPRYAGELPIDSDLYRGDSAKPVWAAAAEPRFPVAAPAEESGILLPLGMSPLPDAFLRAIRPAGTELARDGLATFGPELFVDDRLRESGTEALLDQADFVMLGGEPPLRGVHAALAIDEVTMVAVPDAVHRGWARPAQESVTPPAHVHVPEPAGPDFRDCALRRLRAPRLEATRPDRVGTFTLLLHRLRDHGVVSVVHEARDPGFADAVQLYRGTASRTEVLGRAPGVWYYRARLEAGASVSPWSAGVAVRVGADLGWRAVAESDYRDDALVEVHRAVLRLCAARGDLFAFLSLPGHYREDDAIAYTRRLRSALAAGESRALGYGALHHPWPTTSDPSEPTDFRSIPPDGAVVGVAASRAIDRGAWVAPANEPFRDVVELTPRIGEAELQRLQDAQLNILRQEARGFLVLSADTLSDDVDVRPINVRRLLALLRRAALLHGPRYVFEPNDDALRRRVQRGFEELLGLMFRLGAFAGATASQAFRVEVGDPPNTRQSVDAGRLIVELKVAPSLPLRFLTVRLVERAERGLQLESA